MHVMSSKALALGEMCERYVYLQLHDLYTGGGCSWFAEQAANTSSSHSYDNCSCSTCAMDAQSRIADGTLLYKKISAFASGSK